MEEENNNSNNANTNDINNEFNLQKYNEQLIKKRRKIIIISWVVALIIIFASTLTILLLANRDSCSSSEKIEITNLKMTAEYSSYLGYSCKITGTATNVSGKSLSYVGLEFTVYDENGYNLGSAYDTNGNMANGDKWQFEANLYYASARPSTYKLVKITTTSH